MRPPNRPAAPRPRHLRASDLRGIAQLATAATLGAARITEGVHQSVWQTLGRPGPAPGRTGGLTGLVYRSVHGIAQGVGRGLERSLRLIEPWLAEAPGAAGSPEREAVLAALNGVMGDRLAEAGSPFATPMGLCHQGEPLDAAAPVLAAPSGRLLLLVHGLCMNERAWSPSAEQPHGLGEQLGPALGASVLALRYNTGRPVADNGAELAALLETLVAHWPVPVQQIDLLTHSMGGLVARSAVQAAQAGGMAWTVRLRHLVFLGTPHHGAPLERAGHGVERLLGSNRWSAPFVRLARLRSAGITDLRHGRVRAVPALERQAAADTRLPVPLPSGVACHTVAATTAAKRSRLAERLLGDGLVPLASALGDHADPAHRLAFAEADRHIVYRTGHLALLHSAGVGAQVLAWLGPAVPPKGHA